MRIETLEQLHQLYPTPSARAVGKELRYLDHHMRNFLKRSPLVVISTVGSNGSTDASPRGGDPGFVQVSSKGQLLLPDYKGNNRLDSLRNIVETGSLGLLVFVPGVNELLRVNGTAFLTNDEAYLKQCTYQNHPPKTVIVMEVQEAFLHCAKALMRSNFWSPEAQIDRGELPTMGEMLKDQLGSLEPPETQTEMEARYQEDL